MLKDHARHAEVLLANMVLYDNAVVNQEMLLLWGHSYGLGEQKLPESEELCHTALSQIHLMDRAASLKKMQFLPMVHKRPLGPKFHDYEYTYLDGPEQLFPEHPPLFVRNEAGEYTFRYGPLHYGPLPMIQDCPGARLYRSGEATDQEAVESLFEHAEHRFGGVIPRPGDGTFAASWAMLTHGVLLGNETIYDAWPLREKEVSFSRGLTT